MLHPVNEWLRLSTRGLFRGIDSFRLCQIVNCDANAKISFVIHIHAVVQIRMAWKQTSVALLSRRSHQIPTFDFIKMMQPSLSTLSSASISNRTSTLALIVLLLSTQWTLKGGSTDFGTNHNWLSAAGTVTLKIHNSSYFLSVNGFALWFLWIANLACCFTWLVGYEQHNERLAIKPFVIVRRQTSQNQDRALSAKIPNQCGLISGTCSSWTSCASTIYYAFQ